MWAVGTAFPVFFFTVELLTPSLALCVNFKVVRGPGAQILISEVSEAAGSAPLAISSPEKKKANLASLSPHGPWSPAHLWTLP